MPEPAMKPEMIEKQEGLSAFGYAVTALVGLLFAIGLLLFYVYQVPRMVQSGVQNQVFYILLLPWGLACAASSSAPCEALPHLPTRRWAASWN